MTLVGFEPTISVGERPQNYDLERAVTGTGISYVLSITVQQDAIIYNSLYRVFQKELYNFESV
jgi:hypothetical protein